MSIHFLYYRRQTQLYFIPNFHCAISYSINFKGTSVNFVTEEQFGLILLDSTIIGSYSLFQLFIPFVLSLLF